MYRMDRAGEKERNEVETEVRETMRTRHSDSHRTDISPVVKYYCYIPQYHADNGSGFQTSILFKKRKSVTCCCGVASCHKGECYKISHHFGLLVVHVNHI